MAVPARGLDRPQAGVALLTALLVVSLASVAAYSMAGRQQLDVRRTSNVLEADQAFAYAQGVEDWAAVILLRDREDSKYDWAGEDWARLIPPLPIPGGAVSGRIEDQQGRFNLNNLVIEGKVSEPDMKRFGRLLDVLELEPGLAQSLRDWLDKDIDASFPDGAEDEAYLGLQPAYRAANRPLASLSELRLVAGFDDEVLPRLLPHVSVLPGRVSINVNTATDAVLRSLSEDITDSDVELLIGEREQEGFEALTDFLAHESIAERGVEGEGLGVSSGYFLLSARVLIGRQDMEFFSRLQRLPAGATRVYHRTRTVR